MLRQGHGEWFLLVFQLSAAIVPQLVQLGPAFGNHVEQIDIERLGKSELYLLAERRPGDIGQLLDLLGQIGNHLAIHLRLDIELASCRQKDVGDRKRHGPHLPHSPAMRISISGISMCWRPGSGCPRSCSLGNTICAAALWVICVPGSGRPRNWMASGGACPVRLPLRGLTSKKTMPPERIPTPTIATTKNASGMCAGSSAGSAGPAAVPKSFGARSSGTATETVRMLSFSFDSFVALSASTISSYERVPA